MQLHCLKILQKLNGKNISDWGQDENLRDAVCMRLLALAENTKEYIKICKKSGSPLTSQFPEIPWNEIARFRERLAHHYEGIDYDIVWEIVENDIPQLVEAINKIQKG